METIRGERRISEHTVALTECVECGASAKGILGLGFMVTEDRTLFCRKCYGNYLVRRAAAWASKTDHQPRWTQVPESEVWVNRYRVIGTPTVIYAAYEPYQEHGTSTSMGERTLGKVATRRLPAELEALRPYSEERRIKVLAWIAERYAEAYAAILAVYPEAADGLRSMGDIERNEPMPSGAAA